MQHFMPMQFQRQSLTPLNHKEFRFFLLCRFFYTMALRMVATVVAYQLFQITRSSFSIGIVGLSEFAPVFTLSLYAGHVIDRSDKRTLLLKSMMSYSLCVAALLAVTSHGVMEKITANTTALFFYAIIFCTGIIRAFVGPTGNAIIAQLVPRDVLRFAASLSSTSWLAASILGHASAGFLIAGIGVHNTFFVIFGLVLVAVFLLSRIEKKPVAHTNLTVKAWDSVKEGICFVFGHRVMLGAISLDLFAVLFGGATALIPEFADRILKVGPVGFGWLNAAMDIGSVIMIFSITLVPISKRQGYKLFYAVAGFGLCIIAFGLSRNYWLSFAVLMIGGMLDGISVVIRSTIMQLTTPDEMRGRVSSVNSMFVNSSNELGQFESGFTAKLFGGAAPAVIFGGSMTVLVVILTWLKAPGLRKFEY